MNPADFLQWFSPSGPWVLTSIVPDGRITTRTFMDSQVDIMREWIESVNGYENVYFHVNHTGDRRLGKKATKEDIVEARWLHVDVDPTTDMFDAERKRILEKLQGYVPKPSLIIDSGGGYQAFWRLSEPCLAEDNDWSEFERYSRQIEMELAADHCHNVDRIMRLPGTWNIPNKKKLKKGRVKRESSVVYKDDNSFDLTTFTQAPPLGGTDLGDPGRISVDISGNIPRLSEVDDLDEFGDLPQHYKMLIVQGGDPDQPDKYGSRSEVLWALICEMTRREFPDEIIAAVILDPDFMISGHILDQKNPEASAIRQIQRAKEAAIDPNLEKMNSKYCMAVVGGKLKIMSWGRDERTGTRVPVYMDVTTFEKLYCNKTVQVGTTDKGLPITKKMGKWWTEHPNRRTYMAVKFFPGGSLPSDQLNLWQGFSVVPKQGDQHHLWLKHVRDNICSGNEEHFNYVVGWVARMIQQPATQSETAIVMRGGQGTGKNSFVEPIGKLFREHFFMGADSRSFLGNFNAHLRDKILVFANEAFFAGDKRQEASMKMMITEPLMPVEFKGVDLMMESNYMHLMMASNSDWVVPAGLDERRFLVLDVGNAQKQNDSYFQKMHSALENGGFENLLHFLLNYDISDFNVRKVPQTEALLEQKVMSMRPVEQWWMDRLMQGHGFGCEFPVEDLWQHYIQRMNEEKTYRPDGKIAWGKFLSKALPGLKRKQAYVDGGRKYCYFIPDLQTARDAFDQHFGGPYSWPEVEDEGQRDIPF